MRKFILILLLTIAPASAQSEPVPTKAPPTDSRTGPGRAGAGGGRREGRFDSAPLGQRDGWQAALGAGRVTEVAAFGNRGRPDRMGPYSPGELAVFGLRPTVQRETIDQLKAKIQRQDSTSLKAKARIRARALSIDLKRKPPLLVAQTCGGSFARPSAHTSSGRTNIPTSAGTLARASAFMAATSPTERSCGP